MESRQPPAPSPLDPPRPQVSEHPCLPGRVHTPPGPRSLKPRAPEPAVLFVPPPCEGTRSPLPEAPVPVPARRPRLAQALPWTRASSTPRPLRHGHGARLAEPPREPGAASLPCRPPPLLWLPARTGRRPRRSCHPRPRQQELTIARSSHGFPMKLPLSPRASSLSGSDAASAFSVRLHHSPLPPPSCSIRRRGGSSSHAALDARGPSSLRCRPLFPRCKHSPWSKASICL